MEEKTLLNMEDAADYLGLTRQAISHAYRHNLLKCIKKGKKTLFTKEFLDDYIKNKWSRLKHYGDRYISVRNAAEMLRVSRNRVYYLIYMDLIKAEAKGNLLMIEKEKFLKNWIT